MKQWRPLLMLFLFLFSTVIARQLDILKEPAQEDTAFCAAGALHERRLQTDDAYRAAHQRLEKLLHEQALGGAHRIAALYTLPVVVHIIHENGDENISDAQVEAGIQHLNDAFANTGYYNPATGVDVAVDFCLARRDPAGNATTGINRVESSLANVNSSTQDQALKNLIRWNPLEYINVWVVREICDNNNCGVAGYAYLPGAHGAAYDGIVMESIYLGSSPANSNVLIHEMGHYLGLYHTFEGGCANNDCLLNGDRVCDTPPDNTTARPPCDTETNSCSTDEDDTSANNPFRPVALGGLGDQPDQIQNYMDYSRFQCYDRFTQGQKDRMHGVVEGVRSSLLDSPGCLDPCPSPQLAGFTASGVSVPVGTTVSFTNTSLHADAYEWRLDGVVFSTTTNTSYTFDTEGAYQVTLTAFSNLSNCLPRDSTITIEVYCPVAAGLTAGAGQVLAGGDVVFSNTSTGATQYTWLVNGTVASSAADFTLHTTAPGLFTICLIAGNGLCESVACVTIQALDPGVGNGCSSSFMFAVGLPDYPETGNVLLPASDGGFYLGGSWRNRPLIMKFNENAELLWQKYFWITQNAEEIESLMEDGQYLVGSVNANGNSYCFKYDMLSESFVWLRAFAGPGMVRIYNQLNPEGAPHYLMIGETNAGPPDSCDVVWLEVGRTTGDVLRMAHHTLGSCESGSSALLYNDNIYVTGRYHAAGGGASAMRPALTEFSISGVQQWSRLHLLAPNAAARLYSNSMIEDEGQFIVAGQGDFSGVSEDEVNGFIYKTNLAGEISWARQFSFFNGNRIRANSLLLAPDGYVLIGHYQNQTALSNNTDLFLLKVDKAGNLLWARSLPTDADEENLAASAFSRDGFLYVTATQTTGGLSDILLMKFTPEGLLEGDCAPPEPLEVAFGPIPGPYQGLHPLSATENIWPSNAALAQPIVPPLEAEAICLSPCAEICDNGLDDDGDGLADCEDDDCPCFTACGGTYVRILGDSTTTDGAVTIVAGPDGNLFLGGYLDDEAMIARMTPEGEMFWVRRFDFTDRPDHILHLRVDSDGMLFGINYGTPAPFSQNRTASVFRYDPESDQVLWSNTYTTQGVLNYINVNPATGNYLAGGQVIAATNDEDASLVEFDRNTGNVVWRREFDRGSSETYYDIVPVGNFLYCAARFTHTSGSDKMRPNISAFDSFGNLQWSRQYITPPGAVARQYAFSMEADGDALLAGFLGDPNGTGLFDISFGGLMKTGLAGALIWARQYSLAGYEAVLAPYDMEVTADGYLLYGFAVANGLRDIIVIKVDKEGYPLWAKAYGGAADDDVYWHAGSQVLSYNGYLYITGRTLSASGSEDAIIIRALSDGSVEDTSCVFVRPVEVLTQDLPNAYEGPSGIFEQPFSGINPVLAQVQGQAAAPAAAFACEPLPCVEDCGNAMDDDGDGLVDCEDPDCLCFCNSYDLAGHIDTTYCNGDSLAVAIRICNEGTDTVPAGMPFTVYDGNPTADGLAGLLSGGQSVAGEIAPGACYETLLSLPYPQGSLYLIANDDGSLPPVFNLEEGFPVTDIFECDYTNNLDSATYERLLPNLDLGPDTSLCENGVFLLDAGPGFADYRWQDGSFNQTYTAFEAGAYWVEATTACGDVAMDTITITLDTVIAITLNPDTSICSGASALLSTQEDPGYSYQWSPSATLDCGDCPVVTASPAATTTYTLVVSNAAGCFNVDSVAVFVELCQATLDTALCLGDSLIIEGVVLYPGQTDTVTLNDGTELAVDISALDTFYLAIGLGVCAGETAEYQGMIYEAGQTAIFHYTASTGCDSTHNIYFLVLDTAVLNIPPGQMGCGPRSGSLTVDITGGEAPYQIQWSNGQTTATAAGLEPGQYFVTVTEAFGCQSVGVQWVYDISPVIVATPLAMDASCYGRADGAITIEGVSGGQPPYEYSLDGITYQSAGTFTGLRAADYTVYIRDAGQCVGLASASISEPDALVVELPSDTTLLPGDTLLILPQVWGDSILKYDWSPPDGLDCSSCPQARAFPTETVHYQLAVTDGNGCSARDGLTIYIEERRRVFIPNAFSPNGDGANDEFRIYAGPEVERVELMQVFSRGGELLYEEKDAPPSQLGHGWDGALRGQAMMPGAYVYFIKVRYKDGQSEIFKGVVVLVR